jgi:hypothetical protein
MSRTIVVTHVRLSVARLARNGLSNGKAMYESQFKIALTCVYVSRLRIRSAGAGSGEACDDV